MSHSRNPSALPFHPNASHSKSYPPTFHLLRMSHIRNPIRRRSTFSECLTSGILSSRRSTFFFIRRAFSLGFKITFLIKLCCRFYFWQTIFSYFLCFLKCFEISEESNSVIPSDGVYGINSCKINGLWWGLASINFLQNKNEFEWNVMRAIGDSICLVIWVIHFMFITMHQPHFVIARCRLLIKYASTSILVILYVCFVSHMCVIVSGIHYFRY